MWVTIPYDSFNKVEHEKKRQHPIIIVVQFKQFVFMFVCHSRLIFIQFAVDAEFDIQLKVFTKPQQYIFCIFLTFLQMFSTFFELSFLIDIA